MSKNTSIYRFLPNNEYMAAIGANLPSTSNVFATMDDLTTSQLDIQNNGAPFEVNIGTMNFTGAGVTLTTTGAPNATVTVDIPGAAGSTPGGSGGSIQYNDGAVPAGFAGDAQLHWDAVNANLGIGLTGPGARVHAYGSGQQEMIIESSDSNAALKIISDDANNSYIDFEEASGNRWIVGGYAGANDSFTWSSGSAFGSSLRFQMVRPAGASTAAPELRLYEGDPGGGAGNFVGLSAPDVMTGNVQYTLPATLGSAGAILTQTGATGVLEMSDDVDVAGQVVGGVDLTNVFVGNNCEINCNNGMTQVVDGDALTAAGQINIINPKEGATYAIIFIQGSGTHDVSLVASSYWLSATAFDFSTLADDERAMITATYVDAKWYFAVKELTLI